MFAYTRKKIKQRFASGDANKFNRFCAKTYEKYKAYTMIPQAAYMLNLSLVHKYGLNIQGDVVECGVWKGGMTAGIAELMGKERKYFLFDSFEGLPDAKEIDGAGAKQWQENKDGDFYFDNCTAEEQFATAAMQQTGCDFQLVKGWFDATVPSFNIEKEIAVLRLDADWYDSTIVCLRKFYPMLANKGLLLIDDYYAWDGCSRAVHDYLSEIKSSSKIMNAGNVCYIIKNEQQ